MNVGLTVRPDLRQRVDPRLRVAHAALVVVLVLLVVFLAAPLAAILVQALQDAGGHWVGFANFVAYARTPALLDSLWNSLWVSALVTALVIPLAFGFAYALRRSRMRFKPLFRGITLLPLLAPSLLSAISLIYWFGNQGVLKGPMQALGITQIYGAPGIVLAECFAVFPHALMILVTALGAADGRLYEAAEAMGTRPLRRFFTITLPGAKYGLISAALVTFTLVITDFGVPKVIGGNFNVLATDVFKLVIGQQDFQKGAVVALLLLAPAVFTFAVDRRVAARQTALLTARAVPYRPKAKPWRDGLATAYCAAIAGLVLAMMGMAVLASFAKFWPYDLTPTLNHYAMGLVDAEVSTAFVNSLTLAAGTSLFGTVLVFAGAYLLEKTQGAAPLHAAVRLLAMLPMAVPGAGAGPRHHLLLQCPGQPAGRPVPHDDAADGVHHRPLLHHRAPDRGDRAEGAGRRVRGGVGLAEGAVLGHAAACHAADLHPRDDRHRALFLHQRDDDDLGRRVPLFAGDQGRGDRDPEPRRSRRDGRRRGLCGADHRRVQHRDGRVHRPRLVRRPTDPGLARLTDPPDRRPRWTATASCSRPAR